VHVAHFGGQVVLNQNRKYLVLKCDQEYNHMVEFKLLACGFKVAIFKGDTSTTKQYTFLTTGS
jgi:hypothetical protein